MVRVIYFYVSIIFLVLSMLWPIAIYYDVEQYRLLIFGQKGAFGVLLPVIYGLISIVFAWLSRNKYRNPIILLCVMFVVFNAGLAFVGMYGFRES